jgi:putative glutamine amidotransferase
VVGFCRGHQVINRYFGGEIAPIPKNLDPKVVHKGKVSPYIKDTFHEMEVLPGTRLAGIVKSRRVTINTSHRYHVTELGEGLVVSARSDDGVIEALEHKTLPIIGFQFHPERSFRAYPEHLAMIRYALDPAAHRKE